MPNDVRTSKRSLILAGGDRSAGLARFGRLFLGKLWDVHARDVLTSGPI